MVEVFLATALICFAGECHPVLVGSTTPRGEFKLSHYQVLQPGYGGDVLEFARKGNEGWSIHRTWKGRDAFYERPSVERTKITKGCINVPPALYARLVECCKGATLVIR